MKETKKEYLRRILKITKDDTAYADMNTFMKRYNTFLKEFNLDAERGGEIEKIFVDYYNSGITPANLVAIQKGKENLEKQLLAYSKKAQEYFKCNIYDKQYNKIIETMRPKDADIALRELKNFNSLTGCLENVTSFLEMLNNNWEPFVRELYSTVIIIFSDRYSADIYRKEEFGKVVEEEISYYSKKIKKYEDSFAHKDKYYVGKNKNPYKNIYLYCLNSYIKNFYLINLVTMQPGCVGKLTHMVIPEKKPIYTLKDVAQAYSDMSGEPYEKSYNKIKQQFRKSPFMQQQKNTKGVYEFKSISIPLATYLYYSKKNHYEPQTSSAIEQKNEFIENYYALLLNANMHGENAKLEAFNRYVSFVKSEFQRLTETVNDVYLLTFLEELFLTSLHLRCRCLKGFDLESVIG